MIDWTIEYLEEDNLLYIKTRGVLTMDAANSMVKEIVAATARYQCVNQLVDHRETRLDFNAVDYYERPDIDEQIGISHKWKIAMVFPELTEDTLFMETIFRNRGYNFHQFDDIEEARVWIKGK